MEDVLEAQIGSNPLDADSDGGGDRDAAELFYGRSAVNPCDDLGPGLLGDVMPAGGDGEVRVGDVVRGL